MWPMLDKVNKAAANECVHRPSECAGLISKFLPGFVIGEADIPVATVLAPVLECFKRDVQKARLCV